MSLLDEAKKITRNQRYQWGEEHFELARAWVKGEVTFCQISKVIAKKDRKFNPNNAANMVMYCLREMQKKGQIKITIK